MKAVKLWGLSALAMVLGACGGNQSAGELTLDNLPVVATMEAVGQDSVCMLHLDKLGKDTLTIALSQYLEDFRLVRLDNRDEALTRGGGVCLGNYFITGGGSREACRLFDKDGRFLFRVGNNGQGPGEYWAVYDKQIDEQNRRIYLMPWNATSLLVYDLDTGAYLSSIPLPTMVPKGVFTVDAAKQTVIVGMLPFNDIEGARVVWQQDFEGNVLQGIDATPYAVVPDFSNEVSNMDNMEGTFDFYLFTWVTQADTLYHYIAEDQASSVRVNLYRHNVLVLYAHLLSVFRSRVDVALRSDHAFLQLYLSCRSYQLTCAASRYVAGLADRSCDADGTGVCQGQLNLGLRTYRLRSLPSRCRQTGPAGTDPFSWSAHNPCRTESPDPPGLRVRDVQMFQR